MISTTDFVPISPGSLAEANIEPDKYHLLLQEITSLQHLFQDVHYLVDQQQEQLDIVTDQINNTKDHVTKTEIEINKSEKFHSSNNRLKIALYLAAGSTIGAGFGGIGILLGLKPLIPVLVGGSVGSFWAAFLTRI